MQSCKHADGYDVSSTIWWHWLADRNEFVHTCSISTHCSTVLYGAGVWYVMHSSYRVIDCIDWYLCIHYMHYAISFSVWTGGLTYASPTLYLFTKIAFQLYTHTCVYKQPSCKKSVWSLRKLLWRKICSPRWRPRNSFDGI